MEYATTAQSTSLRLVKKRIKIRMSQKLMNVQSQKLLSS